MRIKKLLCALVISLSFIMMVDPISAEIIPVETCGTGEEAGTFASDIIEYKYRVYEGRLQYRRWNSTKGYWIDATWLDA